MINTQLLSESVHFVFLLLWNFTFPKSLSSCQIRVSSQIRHTDVCQPISKGIIDNFIEWHVFRLWDTLLDRGLTTLSLLGKDVDHHEEHQFASRTDDRVKAATGCIKSLKCPKKSFDVIRGTGGLIVAERWSSVREFASNRGDPGTESPPLLRILGLQSL